MAYKGRYTCKNPHKYKGDPTNIIFRSLWELKAARYFDMHPDIIQWSSEETIVTYVSPLDGRKHRYFPDFVVKRKSKDGSIATYMVEVKPHNQTVAPDPSGKGAQQKSGKPTKRFLKEVATYSVNHAKWSAAKAYCHAKGWQFIIMDEYSLGIKKRK